MWETIPVITTGEEMGEMTRKVRMRRKKILLSGIDLQVVEKDLSKELKKLLRA